jgi:hypothetical protein
MIREQMKTCSKREHGEIVSVYTSLLVPWSSGILSRGTRTVHVHEIFAGDGMNAETGRPKQQKRALVMLRLRTDTRSCAPVCYKGFVVEHLDMPSR